MPARTATGTRVGATQKAEADRARIMDRIMDEVLDQLEGEKAAVRDRERKHIANVAASITLGAALRAGMFVPWAGEVVQDWLRDGGVAVLRVKGVSLVPPEFP